jgi:hypothetical protein
VGRNGSAPARSEERALEQNIYDISSTSELDAEFETLPSELPRLGAFEAGYVYIVNLDGEVLTMNYSIHWNLGNIPRQNSLWLRAIKKSIYKFEPTISCDLCPEEHMASLALVLPARE